MKQKTGFALVIVFIPILVVISAAIIFFSKRNSPAQLNIPTYLSGKQESIFYEKIPGSKFHSPDGTWWGYNQSKIVRFQNLVFIYVIENLDDSNKTASDFVIYKKDSKSKWEKGAAFPTSRPGNILIDSTGVLHAFVFEPTDVAKNDSRGKLMHYFFPDAKTGNISNYREEIVVEAQDDIETVNIRVGAAIAKDDTMAIGFGLTTFNPFFKGHSEHLYFKKPQDSKWTHLIAGEDLGHDFFYPFVVAQENSFHLLPVQDDFRDDGDPKTYDNIYQKIIYFSYKNGLWDKQMITDLSTLPLAKERPRLLEQEDLLVEKDGKVHILYKEFLDETPWSVSSHKHIILSNGQRSEEILDLEVKGVNWIRLFEVDGQLYYLATTWNEVYIGKVGSQNLQKLAIPKDVKAIYPYVSTSNNVVDVLLLGADLKQYDSTSHYYLKVPKALFTKLK